MKKGLKFTKEQLEELYLIRKLSLSRIGNQFNCNGSNIFYWLKKFGIERRPVNHRKIDIPKNVLEDLYWDKGLSSREIAKKYGIKFGRTIRKKLKNYGIKRKTISEALTKKFKAPFCGDLSRKAFFLGLRAGDFYAKQMRKSIRLQTSSTHKAQVELLAKSFKEYGETKKYLHKNKERKAEWFIYVDLYSSFDFLLKKPEKIPNWILEDDRYFYNFLAAYSDCEGNWNLNKSHDKHFRYTFRLRTGDKKILEQIRDRLMLEELHPVFGLTHKKGDKSPYNVFNFNIYIVTLNRKKEILYLIRKILPFSKHSVKIRKMNFILENRNKKWCEIKQELEKLRKEIKKEILN
mgnify:CR=1 FL=1